MTIVNEEKISKNWACDNTKIKDTNNLIVMIEADEENLKKEYKRHEDEVAKINERISKYRNEIKITSPDRYSIFNIEQLSKAIIKLTNTYDETNNYEIMYINKSIVIVNNEILLFAKDNTLDNVNYAYTIGKSDKNMNDVPISNMFIQYTNFSNILLKDNCLTSTKNNESFKYIDRFIDFVVQYRFKYEIEELNNQLLDKLLNTYIERTNKEIDKNKKMDFINK